jgi:release factor glutamine methyltransferase
LYVRQLFLEEKTIAKIDLVSIVSHVLMVSKERLLMEADRQLNQREWRRVLRFVEERRKGKPLAYLTNRREFFSEIFYVDERVLIPRPETELLVEEALALIGDGRSRTSVLDMGTGSGILGVLLAKGGAERVLCVDVSPGAIVVAQVNGRRLGVEERLDFLVSDLFSALRKGKPSFDIICANLPYVSSEEYDELMDDVRCFEPKEALLGGVGGMGLYARFARDVVTHLSPGGAVLCEIGGRDQAEVLGNMLRHAGFKVMVLNDLSGRQRVVRGVWTNLS